jgi:hypothetical protein
MEYKPKTDYYKKASQKIIIIWSIILIIIFIAIFRNGCKCNKGTETELLEVAEIIDTATTEINTTQYFYPDDQSQFITIIEDTKNEYESAENELKKSVIRTKRKKLLKQHFSNGKNVSNWLGNLSDMQTNSDGDAYISIKITIGSTDMYLQTWNNSFSDIFDNTLIKQNSELFNKISNLQEGELVRFSGRFLNGDADYINEQSLTENGSMTQPEFTFRFKSVTNNLEIIEKSNIDKKKSEVKTNRTSPIDKGNWEINTIQDGINFKYKLTTDNGKYIFLSGSDDEDKGTYIKVNEKTIILKNGNWSGCKFIYLNGNMKMYLDDGLYYLTLK